MNAGCDFDEGEMAVRKGNLNVMLCSGRALVRVGQMDTEKELGRRIEKRDHGRGVGFNAGRYREWTARIWGETGARVVNKRKA